MLYTQSLRQVQLNTEKREPFEKCSILFKIKEGENFNHRNM